MMLRAPCGMAPSITLPRCAGEGTDRTRHEQMKRAT